MNVSRRSSHVSQQPAQLLSVLRSANVGKQQHGVDAETTPLREVEHYQYDFNLRDVAEVTAGKCDLIVATRFNCDCVGSGSRAFDVCRPSI